MGVLKSLLLCSLAAILLWGGWARGGFSYTSTGLLAYTSHAQLIFGSPCPLGLCSWGFVIICIYHPALSVEDSGQIIKLCLLECQGFKSPC